MARFKRLHSATLLVRSQEGEKFHSANKFLLLPINNSSEQQSTLSRLDASFTTEASVNSRTSLRNLHFLCLHLDIHLKIVVQQLYFFRLNSLNSSDWPMSEFLVKLKNENATA